MPFNRTSVGNPYHTTAQPHRITNPENTSSAIAAMASLGSKLAGTYADYQEGENVRDANNDILNDSINPDRAVHEAAYAWTVAKNEAQTAFNTLKTGINNGEFDDTDPNEFQKKLKEGHKAYAEKWSGNPFGKQAIAAYNEFTIGNEPTLVAGQAGKWRLRQGDKQETALNVRIAGMTDSGNYSLEAYKEVIESDEFSLVDGDRRLLATVLGAAQASALSGDPSVLRGLNEEYGLSVNPTTKAAYNSAITATNRAAQASSRQHINEIINQVHGLVESGVLMSGHFKTYSNLKDAKGTPVWTPKQWQALVEKSSIVRAKMGTKAQRSKLFEAGINLGSIKQGDFDGVALSTFQKILDKAEGDTTLATEAMGALLVDQTQDWTELKGRLKMFERQPLMIDNKPNPAAMQQYEELAALERGMNNVKDGEKTFNRYIGDSLPLYITIRDGLELTKSGEEAAWTSMAASIELQEKEVERKTFHRVASTEGLKVGKAIAEEIWADSRSSFIPDVILDRFVPEDNITSATALGARVYDETIAKGFGEAAAIKTAKIKVSAMTQEFGGKLVNNQGIDLRVVLGSDLDEAYKTILQDPVWMTQLEDMFGTYLKTITGGDPTKVDASFFIPKILGGEKEAITEAELREVAKQKSEAVRYLDPKNIKMDVDMETGMLVFSSPIDGGQFYSIPMADVKQQTIIRNQGIEGLDNLNRYYSDEYLKTPEGEDYFNTQVDKNNTFVTEVLREPAILAGRKTVSAQEYVGMSQEDQTRVRLEFYEDNYKGIKGRASQIRDYFIAKTRVAHPPLTPLKKGWSDNINGKVTKSIPQRKIEDSEKAKGNNIPGEFGHNLTVNIKAGLGAKNNNPGNLRSSSLATGKMGGMATFDTPEQGFSALKRQISLDAKRGDTIRTFLEVFAPASENDTEKYIKDLSKELGATEGTKLNTLDNTDVAKAVAKLESNTTFK